MSHRQQVYPERTDRARGGPDEAAQHVEEGGLAGAVRSDEAAGTLLEGQAHVVQRGDAAVADGQAFDFDHVVLLGAGLRSLLRRKRPRRARSLGTWSARPAGAVVRT